MITIRKATKHHVPFIAEISLTSATAEQLEGFVLQGAFNPYDSAENLRRCWGCRFVEPSGKEWFVPRYGLIVAERLGKVVGFASYLHEREKTQIDELDVGREFQGRGIGRALVRYIEGTARRRNKKKVITGTAINAHGRRWKAFDFWVHLGFEEAGEIRARHGIRHVKLVKHLK